MKCHHFFEGRNKKKKKTEGRAKQTDVLRVHGGGLSVDHRRHLAAAKLSPLRTRDWISDGFNVFRKLHLYTRYISAM